MNKRTKLRLLLICILIGFIISPAFADDTTINLNQTTPYIDIPVTVTEPVDATISTTTGLPNSGTWIDSWIELWQGTTRIAFNDDGNHSNTNFLASIINIPLAAGEYFIRATSWNYVASNGTQFPTGSYLLSTNLIASTPTPTPTPEPTQTVEPTPTPTETVEPSPTPTETVTPTPEPTETATPTPTPTQPSNTPEPTNEPTSSPVTPSAEPTPTPQETINQELEQVEQIVEPETIEAPIVEPEHSVEEIQEILNQEYIAENTIELQLPTALADIPGVAEIFAATEAILNVGSDMTQEQREESQSVVVGAIVVTQIASMASAASVQSSNKRNETKRIKRK